MTIRFVIETYDNQTECIVDHVPLDVVQVEEFFRMLNLDTVEPHEVVDLDAEDIRKINLYFSLKIESHLVQTKLRQRAKYDDLPYQLHTNRELALMLAGVKPLSTFSGTWPPSDVIEEIPERLFDPHVLAGTFVKGECLESIGTSSTQNMRRVLYALKEEAWRINAHFLLWKTATKSGWNEGFERFEGSLLGYTDAQNDAYIEFIGVSNRALP